MLILLPRDAMRKHGLCCGPVSIYLSHWCIVSTRLKISSNFFLSPVAPSFEFFDPQSRYQISKGTPSTGGVKTRGWENFEIFNWNRRQSMKRNEIGQLLLWNV